jgi:protein-S-isoprenylcysteine O-methyltransferase Ste14
MNDKPSKSANTLVVLLAIVFTLALTFVTVEGPRVVERWLRSNFDIPDPHPVIEPERIEQIMAGVRPTGYACLTVVVGLMFVGLLMEKSAFSAFGSIAFFLPTFGHFASYMFFLAGTGVLRLLWIPLWDPLPVLLKLGDVVYLPYMILVYPFALLGLDIRRPLAYLTIASGLAVFLLGTVAWFFGKLRRKSTIDTRLYAFCRHPQYLGWLLWSYGVMLLAALAPIPRGGQNPGASLPWLVSAVLIVCVALTEEMHMVRKQGDEYTKYRDRVPFMISLPSSVLSALSAPFRLQFKRSRPENGKEIFAVFWIYLILLVGLSLPFVLLNWPPGLGWAAWPYNMWPFG